MLTVPHCKESLSRAYITAVVGRSRNNLAWGREYDYGVDGSVKELKKRGTRIRETGLGFDFQAKSTINWSVVNGEIVYDLEATAYNDLVARSGTDTFPFLLVLLCLHPDENTWLRVSDDELVLQRCAYWCQVRGVPTLNSQTIRIRIPLSNVFTPNVVTEILADISAGRMLP